MDVGINVHKIRNGYMVRDLETGQCLTKFKSPYYLAIKFVSRMGGNNIEHMFKSPASFKEKMDEEFYPLVDAIVGRYRKEDFLALSDAEKRDAVRDLVNAMRGEVVLQEKRVRREKHHEAPLAP